MKTADDHELNLAFAAVELGAESGVATIMTGKSQSGSRNDVDRQQSAKLSAEKPCSTAQVQVRRIHRSCKVLRRSPIASMLLQCNIQAVKKIIVHNSEKSVKLQFIKLHSNESLSRLIIGRWIRYP